MIGSKFIVANFKMNKTVHEAEEFLKNLVLNGKKWNLEVIICPTFLCLERALNICHKSGIKIGAQNCYFEKNGAFTGEVSAFMLSSVGAEYVILGHSERRTYFFETDDIINKKVISALENNLKPIICVGETEFERENGTEKEKIKSQIDFALKGAEPEQLDKVIIAYEPIWAIGTGKVVDYDDARKMFLFIKNHLVFRYGKNLADKIKLLYGGSINENNVKELLGIENIDGGLIGGASLDFSRFMSILNQAENSDKGE